MMNYDAMLDKKYLGECLKTPMGTVKAYRYILDNPEILEKLSKEEAKTLYVIANLSQRTCPNFYGDSFAKKPNNGFLDYLIKKNPYVDEGDKIDFVKAAKAFTPTEMKKIQRSRGNPLEHKLNGHYTGRMDRESNRKGEENGARRFVLDAEDRYYKTMLEQHFGIPGVPSTVLAEEGY